MDLSCLPIEVQKLVIQNLPSLNDRANLSQVSSNFLCLIRDDVSSRYELTNIGIPLRGDETYSQCMEKIKSIYAYVLGIDDGKELVLEQKKMKATTFVDFFKPIYSYHTKENLTNFEKFYEEIEDRSNWKTETYLSLTDDKKYTYLQDLFSNNREKDKKEFLHLSDKKMTCLPKEIFQLSNLQTLDAENNRLKSLPSEIRQLSQLQGLYLSSNQLETLPEEIGELSQLVDLRALRNNLQSLPLELRELSELQGFSIHMNPFKELNPEILNTDISAICNNQILINALAKKTP